VLEWDEKGGRKAEASNAVFCTIHVTYVRGLIAGVKSVKRKVVPVNTVKAYEEVEGSSTHS
jgi:hypothetical protein